MAFTGTPVVKRVEDQLARITGLSIAAGATGTISLAVGAGEVKLPASLQWAPYAGQDAGDGKVDLEESVQVSYVFVTDTGGTDASDRIAVTKTGGADPATFLITFQSFSTDEDVSGQMEIWVRFH
jgi:hypothetical protein